MYLPTFFLTFGIMMILATSTFYAASLDHFATLRQVRKHHQRPTANVPEHIPAWRHGGMLGLWVWVIVLPYFNGKFVPRIDTTVSFLSLVVGVLVTFAALLLWQMDAEDKTKAGTAINYDSKTPVAGWIHGVAMIFIIWDLLCLALGQTVHQMGVQHTIGLTAGLFVYAFFATRMWMPGYLKRFTKRDVGQIGLIVTVVAVLAIARIVALRYGFL